MFSAVDNKINIKYKEKEEKLKTNFFKFIYLNLFKK